MTAILFGLAFFILTTVCTMVKQNSVNNCELITTRIYYQEPDFHQKLYPFNSFQNFFNKQTHGTCAYELGPTSVKV